MHTFESIVTQVKLGGAVTSQLTVHMLQQMPLERLYAEGFRNWDGTMVLLPLWAFNHMAPGEHLVCIDGEIRQVGLDEMDDDTRGGCVAYGIQRDDIPAKGSK